MRRDPDAAPVLLAMPSEAPPPLPAALSPPPVPFAAAPVGRGSRPLGVAILAALDGIGGLVLILLGIAAAVAGSLLGAFLFGGGLVGAASAALGALIGVFFVVLGVVLLLLAYGMWTGAPWAWTVALVLVLLGIVFELLSLLMLDLSALVSLVVDLFLLWYLTRDGVQRWFGKQGSWPAAHVNQVLERANLPR